MGQNDDTVRRLRRVAIALVVVLIVVECALLLLGLDVVGLTAGPSPLLATKAASALRGVLRIVESVCKAGALCCLALYLCLRFRGTGR